MNSRFIGGILLIVGTSIGGGMLALPIANASMGFGFSSLFLILCWALMTFGALFILEANLYLPAGKNMVSMAAKTLGNPGLILAWLSYLFLLYSLLAGYISGGADVLGSLIKTLGFSFSETQSAILFTVFFGLIVYGGIRQVDLVNRLLMFAKLAVYLILIVLIAPQVNFDYFSNENIRPITGVVMLLITSFGYAIILPNLREYFEDNIHLLRRVILIGSLIPLFCYLAWDAVIMGTIPLTKLAVLFDSDHPTSLLAENLNGTLQNHLISVSFNFFTSICMLTAFLGVSLCLMSFLADGLGVVQKGRGGLILAFFTFVPPLTIVIFQPGIYIQALNYAGIFCVILLLFLPALMTVFGRKRFNAIYQVPGGVFTQIVVISASILLLLNSLWQLFFV